MAENAAPQSGPVRPHETISTARKVRLALMCALLVALMVTAGVLALQRSARQRVHRRQVAEALRQMRQALATPNTLTAEALWRKVKRLDPQNVEADRLLVPTYLAADDVDGAMRQFNALVSSGALRVPAAPEVGADPAASAVLARLQPGRPTMQPGDLGYASDELLLSTLARRITAGAGSERTRALLLCRWFALHVQPADPYGLPADPRTVLERGFGSPQQAAWAYAELARQAGLDCAVVVPASGAARLVQVYPAGSGPFLVDPGRGVPLLDPASHKLLSLASPHLANSYNALLAMAGQKSGHSPQELQTATLQRAVPPSALIPRFGAFDRLCAPLPVPPRLACKTASLPDGKTTPLWVVPFQTADTYADPERAAAFEAAHRWLHDIGKLGALLLVAPDARADAVLAGAGDQIAKALARPGPNDKPAVLRDEAEAIAFWQGSNAHDTGEHGKAQQLLRAYADAYPRGHWLAVAAALRADSLARSGQAEAATAAWRKMPPGRRLYGAMRAAGLLPIVAPAAATPH